MEELTLDNVIEQMEAEIESRVSAVAADFAGKLRQAIPRRKKGKSRGTADRVAVTSEGRLRKVVTVPWPWSFGEFGRMGQAANPVVRRTLLENSKAYEQQIAGK